MLVCRPHTFCGVWKGEYCKVGPVFFKKTVGFPEGKNQSQKDTRYSVYHMYHAYQGFNERMRSSLF